MSEDSEVNVLVSNIVDKNHYSHCRICLKLIGGDQFAKFHDGVAYSSNNKCLRLHEVLTTIFGKEVCDEIDGVDAVCSDCLDKALEALYFIQKYEASTLKLNRVVENLNATLNIHTDVTDQDQKLYILCSEKESQLIYVQNKNKVEKPVQKTSFKCFNCKESFENICGLKEHNKDQHDTYTCEKCMFTSKNELDVEEHELSIDFYRCKECPQFRCTEDSLKDHEASSHGLHVCQECGKPIKGLDKLLAHEEKHMSKNECPKCGKTYTTKEFFTKHVKLCLENRVDPHPMRSRQEKTYFCKKCDKGYSTPGGLRVHQRFVHGNAKPHVCRQCGKKFTAPCYLKVHMVTHTKEKNFPCDLCSGKFVSKEALLYHRRRHTGEKPYSCDLCNEKFVNASARAEHIKFKHVGPTLSCELCSRKFVTKNFLRLHMKKHYDPLNKLFIGRSNIPPNVPGKQNMRVRCLMENIMHLDVPGENNMKVKSVIEKVIENSY